MKTSQRYRKMAAVIRTFICMAGFVLSVVVAAGWGFFPALALLFMTALTTGMMAITFSLIDQARRLDTATLRGDLGVDVRTEAHHPTATEWCSCHWSPNPVPLNPDGSGDTDALERMGRIHRMEKFLETLP